jgi:predicted PurR-regulated permease PerM
VGGHIVCNPTVPRERAVSTRTSPGDQATTTDSDSRPPAATRRALLVAVLLLSACTLWTLRALIPAVLLGAWLAAVTEPLSARIARRLGGRTRAASLLTAALLLVLGGVAAALVLPVVSDVTAGLRALRQAVASGGGGAALAQAFSSPSAAASPSRWG